jgi:hypothetical protein
MEDQASENGLLEDCRHHGTRHECCEERRTFAGRWAPGPTQKVEDFGRKDVEFWRDSERGREFGGDASSPSEDQHITDLREAILQGASERLAPILMTALATGLALVPLVISGNLPGHEIEYPMAVVILGGLTTSTVLNLFLLPPIYAMFGRIQRTAE